MLLAVGYVSTLIVMAIAILTVVDRIRDWRDRVPPEEAARLRQRALDRLRRPEWEQLATHFGANAATTLRALYGSDLVFRENITFRCPTDADANNEEDVAGFLPADRESLKEASWVVADGSFPFAVDGFGNYYTVDFATGAPVRVHMHDGGDAWEVARNLDEFLARPESHAQKEERG